MEEYEKMYIWRWYERLLICLGAVFFWGVVLWGAILTLWNRLAIPDQGIDPFYPRLVLGGLLLVCLAFAYFYPRRHVLLVWGLSGFILYLTVRFMVTVIAGQAEVNSLYYMPDEAWHYHIDASMLCFLGASGAIVILLLRPAVVHLKFLFSAPQGDGEAQ